MLGDWVGALGNPAAPFIAGGPVARNEGPVISLGHPAFSGALLQGQQAGLSAVAVDSPRCSACWSHGVSACPTASRGSWGFGGHWGSLSGGIAFEPLPCGNFALPSICSQLLGIRSYGEVPGPFFFFFGYYIEGQ